MIHVALAAYAAFMLLAAVLVARLPVLRPPPAAWNRPALLGLIYVGVVLYGVGFGLTMPLKIASFVSDDWRYAAALQSDIGVSARLAQLVGMVTGAWIAIRGLYLWVVLGLAYGVVLVTIWVIAWVLGGSPPR